eukprot:m.84574 g.84574  ORF g.84574 m.84574 type:complete len:1019 (-) comp11316_c0_seq1:273-3329(-)
MRWISAALLWATVLSPIVDSRSPIARHADSHNAANNAHFEFFEQLEQHPPATDVGTGDVRRQATTASPTHLFAQSQGSGTADVNGGYVAGIIIAGLFGVIGLFFVIVGIQEDNDKLKLFGAGLIVIGLLIGLLVGLAVDTGWDRGYIAGVVLATLLAIGGLLMLFMSNDDENIFRSGLIMLVLGFVIGLSVCLSVDSNRKHQADSYRAGVVIASLLTVLGCAALATYMRNEKEEEGMVGAACIGAAIIIGLSVGLTQDSGRQDDRDSFLAGVIIASLLATAGTAAALYAAVIHTAATEDRQTDLFPALAAAALFLTLALVIGLSVGLSTGSGDGFLVGVILAVFGAVVGVVCMGVAWFRENNKWWLFFASASYTVSVVLGLIVGLRFESEWNHEPSGYQAGVTFAVLLLAVAVGCAAALYIHRAATWQRRLCLGSAGLQAFLSALVIGLAVGLTQDSGTNHKADGFVAGMVITGAVATLGLVLAATTVLKKAKDYRKPLMVASSSVLAVAVLIGLSVGLSLGDDSPSTSHNTDDRGTVAALAVLLTLVLFGNAGYCLWRQGLEPPPRQAYDEWVVMNANVPRNGNNFQVAGTTIILGHTVVIVSDIAAHMASARAALNATVTTVAAQYVAVSTVQGLSLANFERVRRIGNRTVHLRGTRYYGCSSAVFLMNLTTPQGSYPMALKVLYTSAEENSQQVRNRYAREADLTNGQNGQGNPQQNNAPRSPFIISSFGTFMDVATKATLGDSWDADEGLFRQRTLFMAMEYLPLSLQQLVSQRTQHRGLNVENPDRARLWPPVLTPSEFILILQRLLLAVCYLVQEGVVHRDIKPDNVMLDGPCTRENTEMTADSSPTVVKLADFGEASRNLNVAYVNEAEMVNFGGAQSYLAPEVVNAEPGTIEAPTYIDYTKNDVYAVGMVAHYMVTNGLADKDGGNQAFTTLEHKLMAQNTYRGLPEGCPQAIRDLLWDMVNPAPDQRISERVALDRVNAMIDGDPLLLAWRVEAEAVRAHQFSDMETEV